MSRSIPADEPFRTPPRRRVLPRAMREPPALDWPPPGRVAPRTALLINPFYPKDPHASFGKHVLTPTLALTSIAGGHAARLGRALLGREPAAGAAARRSDAGGRRHHACTSRSPSGRTRWRAGIARAARR